MIRPSVLVKYMRDNRTRDDVVGETWLIDYASTYLAATDKSKLRLPCFYVELNTTGASIESDNDPLQLFTTNIRVRLVCLNKNARTGRIGADTAFYARQELFRILLFKEIDPNFNQIYFVGDSFEALDEARYIHTFDFSFTGRVDITYATEPNYDLLRGIDVDYNLVESLIEDQPNTQAVIDIFQD